MELKQIEANVVVVLTNPDMNKMRVIPHWECDTSLGELMQHVAQSALRFCEDCGGGMVDVEIFDYRNK